MIILLEIPIDLYSSNSTLVIVDPSNIIVIVGFSSYCIDYDISELTRICI
jgi:hypothetical protein